MAPVWALPLRRLGCSVPDTEAAVGVLYAQVRAAASPALVTVLCLGAEHSWVAQGQAATPGQIVRLDWGLDLLVRRQLRHSPPLPIELEQAIEWVEDAVMPLASQLARGADLYTDAPALYTGTRADVEDHFNRLVAVSLGRPGTQESLPCDARTVAAVLVVREFMHHLHFERLGVVV
jgi:hypothetical protein